MEQTHAKVLEQQTLLLRARRDAMIAERDRIMKQYSEELGRIEEELRPPTSEPPPKPARKKLARRRSRKGR